MTIGMEIECIGNSSNFIMYNWNQYRDWQAKADGTIPDGVEIVSPIMHANENYTNQIYTLNSMLSQMRQRVDDRCGAHVHIGADYLTSKEAFDNLEYLWLANKGQYMP